MIYKSQLNPEFTTTTPIRYKDEEGGGTGFFLNYRGKTYIVTNRHVVDPEDVSPTEARIWFRDYDDLESTRHFDIPLKHGEGVDWYGHIYGDQIDIAIVPINQKLSTLEEGFYNNAITGSLAFTREHYIHDNIVPDNNVTILGYPGDFADRSTFFPIKRNALISSPYGRPFDGKPYFVTDARMHPGTSGSPVIMTDRGIQNTQGEVPEERIKEVYLLGVHSATFYRDAGDDLNTGTQLWTEPQDSSAEGSKKTRRTKYDLNVAWYPKLIDGVLGNEELMDILS
ncbi:hypothetical protein DMJ13_03595 [halophilic archaeon]|nr:hypothetical protein DMJ13_03595 [halophilic archaeon]